jgi:GPH family glycoside/pentoside/hexuronide:cation symporter
MLSTLPAIGAGLSAVFILLYPLSEAKLKPITEELNEKRKAAGIY